MDVQAETELWRLILDANPWQQTGEVPKVWTRPRRRTIATLLPQALQRGSSNRYHMVIGPRRVGKSVALFQALEQLLEDGIARERLWRIDLMNPFLMRVPLGELLNLLLRRQPATPDRPHFLFLDELTFAENWELWLKTFYDEARPIRLVGTSSATAALRQGRVESGIGRWEDHYLPPCLFSEYSTLRQRPHSIHVSDGLGETLMNLIHSPSSRSEGTMELQRYILTGGFPELFLPQTSPSGEGSLFADDIDLQSAALHSQRTLQSDAIQKAIHQDIADVFDVRNPRALERLLYTLADQVTGVLSLNNLSQSLDLTAPTIDKYVGYLERSYLIFLLPQYASKEEPIQRRGRKLYFVDSAVRNAALQRGLRTLQDPAELGVLFENTSASHLHALGELAGVRVYHWRHAKQEVDLIYDDLNRPLAFEITASPRHSLRGFTALQQSYPRFEGGCYLVSPDAIPREAKGTTPGSLPLDLFLLAVGEQAKSASARRLGL